jgi:hypothetical protein
MNDFEKAMVIINKADYQVSNIDKFASIYFYLHALKKKVTELEDIVRKKGAEMMFDMDMKSIGYNEFDILKIDPTETESYSASSVIEGLGMERAIAFLKVDSSITKYLKKASGMGAVTMQEVTACRRGLTKKHKKGYLKIQKKKS